MATGENWTDLEIQAIVADYMHMLTLELSGQRYTKAKHRRTLMAKLAGRSEASIELKHQNISAVLRDLGCHWIPGYKPLGNYQRLLANTVGSWIEANKQFDSASIAAAELPAGVPSAINFSDFVKDAPKYAGNISQPVAAYHAGSAVAVKRDYVAREARNVSLGKAGELLVLEYEDFRLRAAGKKQLADRIEHTSDARGDGFGYDILSFELSGRERFIEVKTTAFAKETPFFASRNEVNFANSKCDQFHLYRLFDFRNQPKLFTLQGRIDTHCRLDPVSYICSFS